MTTLAPPRQSPPRRLRKDEIDYVAMEGGGGKGFAYVGAAAALEEMKIMPGVRGFAGASAGAIFSMLLSLGYTSARLVEFMEKTNFARFFDPPEPRLRPRIGAKYERVTERSPREEDLLKQLNRLPIYGGLAAWVLSSPGLTGVAGPLALAWLTHNVLTAGDDLGRAIEEHKDKPPFDLLLRHWNLYLAYIGRDMGLFAGEYARDLFNRELVEAIRASGKPVPVDERDLRAVTFEMHNWYFEKELLLTGTNLSTGRTQLFSHKTTPRFPVADAVRISMSLPFLYKPYLVDEDRRGWPECGTYVDGGVWNNIPFREFDETPRAEGPTAPDGRPPSAAILAEDLKPRTLGLRLAYEPVEPVRDFGEFFKRYVQFGLAGSGETQVLSKHADQLILLDTEPLSTINFTPPKRDRDLAIKRARRATFEYFGEAVPENPDYPEDAESKRDYEQSKKRLEKTRACGEEAIAPLPFLRR